MVTYRCLGPTSQRCWLRWPRGAARASVALRTPRVIPACCQGGEPLRELRTQGGQHQKHLGNFSGQPAVTCSCSPQPESSWPPGPLSPGVAPVDPSSPRDHRGERCCRGQSSLCCGLCFSRENCTGCTYLITKTNSLSDCKRAFTFDFSLLRGNRLPIERGKDL